MAACKYPVKHDTRDHVHSATASYSINVMNENVAQTQKMSVPENRNGVRLRNTVGKNNNLIFQTYFFASISHITNQMPRSADIAIELLLPAVVLIHLAVAPYTKVEESFNIQATHDIITWGFPITNQTVLKENFDHFSFPGVVPRTFVGAAVLGSLTAPFIDVFSEGVYRQMFGMKRFLVGLLVI